MIIKLSTLSCVSYDLILLVVIYQAITSYKPMRKREKLLVDEYCGKKLEKRKKLRKTNSLGNEAKDR